MNLAQPLLLIAALLIMAFGTIAAVLPVVPGPALCWFAAMIYAIATNFQEIGIVPIILLSILMIIGSTTNLWMAALGVKVTGGSLWGVVGGLVGMTIGLIILFPVGALIGSVVGTMGMELVATRDWRKVLKSGGGSISGFLLGVVAEFVVSLLMDSVFLVSLYLAHRNG